MTGRIVAAGPDEVTLEVPATKKTPARTTSVRYAEVSRAVVQVEFSRPAGPTADGDDADISEED